MGNLGFADHAELTWCCILLLLGGLTMIALGPVGRQSRFGAGLYVVLGMVFLGYGLYLAFGSDGGHYYFSFWALILPAVLIVRTVRASDGKRLRRYEASRRARYAALRDAREEAHAATFERRSQ